MIAESAEVHDSVSVPESARVWDLVQIREGAVIGEETIVGRGAYVDAGVLVGARCKIQNHALLYAPAVLADGVFIGPAVVLTNDVYPRAVDPDGRLLSASGWEAKGVTIGEGAAVGARAVVVAGVTIGPWALIGAGAVVVDDVPAHALMVGVPARRIAWVARSGQRMTSSGAHWVDGDTGERFVEVEEGLVPV